MARHPLSLVRLDRPAGWQDASVISYVAPETEGFRANVLVTQEPVDDPDVIAFARRQDTELSGALAQYQVVAREAVKIGSLDAQRVEYTFASPAGDKVRQNVLYVLLGDIAYTLVMTCEDRGAAAAKPLFDRVVASFKIEA